MWTRLYRTWVKSSTYKYIQLGSVTVNHHTKNYTGRERARNPKEYTNQTEVPVYQIQGVITATMSSAQANKITARTLANFLLPAFGNVFKPLLMKPWWNCKGKETSNMYIKTFGRLIRFKKKRVPFFVGYIHTLFYPHT